LSYLSILDGPGSLQAAPPFVQKVVNCGGGDAKGEVARDNECHKVDGVVDEGFLAAGQDLIGVNSEDDVSMRTWITG